MNLKNAYLCRICEEIQDGAARGRCNACTSEEIYPLAWAWRFKEWRKWLRRIHGQGIITLGPGQVVSLAGASRFNGERK